MAYEVKCSGVDVGGFHSKHNPSSLLKLTGFHIHTHAHMCIYRAVQIFFFDCTEVLISNQGRLVTYVLA